MPALCGFGLHVTQARCRTSSPPALCLNLVLSTIYSANLIYAVCGHDFHTSARYDEPGICKQRADRKFINNIFNKKTLFLSVKFGLIILLTCHILSSKQYIKLVENWTYLVLLVAF